MSYIRNKEYTTERERPKLLTHYVEQMKFFLKTQYPQATDETIDGFVKEKIRERFKPPQLEAIVHRTEGNSENVTMRLDTYITDIVKDNNLSPSGTCYHPVSRKESFLRISIDDKVKARNTYKKLYLAFEAQGQKRESQYYNLNQANSKIFNNAIAGGMKVKQFILGCKAGFNAITSVGRMCVKQGYSYIERAVNGNIYLPTMRDAISYALGHARHIPEGFAVLITDNVLYSPTTNEVLHYLVTSVQNYTIKTGPEYTEQLFTTLSNLSKVQQAYVFYAGCLNNLCRYNEDIMRGWIDSCFLPPIIDPVLYQDVNIDDVKSFSGDVIACVLSTNYRHLGENPKKPGKWNTLKDAAVNNPEGLKAFIFCCNHFVTNFEKLIYILRPILQVETTFAKLTHQHKMARYTVPLSDTDSNIFSTQELIRWKRGKIDFAQESYEMNAITTFILSQTLEHIFARLSAGFGVEGKDVFRISMKNEFLYPIMIVTALAKHYIAIATMQEGSLLPNPRKDIKGIGLRSSAYPKLVRESFDAFITELIALIHLGEPIRASYILKHVSDVEQTIYKSIQSRDSDYLQTVSIKRKEEYADPSSSTFFYYELWKAVFAADYGEMIIPTKCFKIPFKGGKQLFKDPVFMERMKTVYPKIYKRLTAFMEQNPKRDISTILIPPFKGQIQPFFLEIMDIRAHISQVMAGYYHVLDSLGIGSVDIRVNGLVSDFYDPSTPVLE